jgi:hypothetical protein
MKRLTVIAILVTTLAGVADARPLHSPVRHCSVNHPELCYGTLVPVAPMTQPTYIMDPHQDGDAHWAGGGGGGGGGGGR